MDYDWSQFLPRQQPLNLDLPPQRPGLLGVSAARPLLGLLDPYPNDAWHGGAAQHGVEQMPPQDAMTSPAITPLPPRGFTPQQHAGMAWAQTVQPQLSTSPAPNGWMPQMQVDWNPFLDRRPAGITANWRFGF